jgi:6-phosphogluconolactonase
MRMKLKKPGQLLLVAVAGVGVASLLSACNQLTGTLTVDFVYVTSAKAAGPNNYGQVDVFEVDSESGRMRQIPTSPFPSGGRNPVAEAVSTDHNNLYVVNRDDNTIVQFVIGNDGKIYPNQTANTPGIFPLAATVSGSMLFVADTYQPLPTCSPAAPCPGSVAAYPIAGSATACTTAGGGGSDVGGLCPPGANSA